MAQYRRTFFSMGGPERIADPGADEAARLGALLLQKQQQAQAMAHEQARMTLEERLATQQGAREDARLRAEQDMQAAVGGRADRAYGLDQQRFAEQQRAALAGEQAQAGQFEATIGRADMARTQASRELEAARHERVQAAQTEAGARVHAEALRLADQARAEDVRAAHEATQRSTDFGMQNTAREQEEAARAGENAKDRTLRRDENAQRITGDAEVNKTTEQWRATARDEAAANAATEAALKATDYGSVSFRDRAVDPGFNLPGKFGKIWMATGAMTPAPFGGPIAAVGALLNLASYDPKAASDALAQDMISRLTINAEAKTPEALRAARAAIIAQARLDFALAAEEQRNGYGPDNSEDQAKLLQAAIAKLDSRFFIMLKARAGAPQPQAAPAPREAPRPIVRGGR